MIERRNSQCLLTPEDIPPSDPSLKVIGAFNPGVAEVDGEVVLLLRVAETVTEGRDGFTALPYWVVDDGEPRVDVHWAPDEEVEPVDARVVRWGPANNTRLTFISYLMVVRAGADGRTIDADQFADAPRFLPANAYERFGVEDARLVHVAGQWYFTYVAVSPFGACTALASTEDFVSFERHGVIFPPENKDVLLFPARIDGDFWAIHRPNPYQHFNPPEMWTARSADLVRWGEHRQLFGGSEGAAGDRANEQAAWQIGRVGGSVPPIRVDEGWLEIYHGNSRRPDAPSEDVGTYAAGAILLDADDPSRVIKRSPEPIMLPAEKFETSGFVPNVIFPTGAVRRDDTLLIYYGAADTSTAVTEMSLSDILATLR